MLMRAALAAMLCCAPATAAGSWTVAALDTGFAAHAAQDWPLAERSFRRLADQGSAVGETMLGTMYARGQGVPADLATAAAYWLRAASRGYAPAQLAFAKARASGAGVKADASDAWRWARIAETHGEPAVAAQARVMRLALGRRLPPSDVASLEEAAQGWRPWASLKR